MKPRVSDESQRYRHTSLRLPTSSTLLTSNIGIQGSVSNAGVVIGQILTRQVGHHVHVNISLATSTVSIAPAPTVFDLLLPHFVQDALYDSQQRVTEYANPRPKPKF
jgi:hypothetical protein